jgi:hypothetical protein
MGQRMTRQAEGPPCEVPGIYRELDPGLWDRLRKGPRSYAEPFPSIRLCAELRSIDKGARGAREARDARERDLREHFLMPDDLVRQVLAVETDNVQELDKGDGEPPCPPPLLFLTAEERKAIAPDRDKRIRLATLRRINADLPGRIASWRQANEARRPKDLRARLDALRQRMLSKRYVWYTPVWQHADYAEWWTRESISRFAEDQFGDLPLPPESGITMGYCMAVSSHLGHHSLAALATEARLPLIQRHTVEAAAIVGDALRACSDAQIRGRELKSSSAPRLCSHVLGNLRVVAQELGAAVDHVAEAYRRELLVAVRGEPRLRRPLGDLLTDLDFYRRATERQLQAVRQEHAWSRKKS